MYILLRHQTETKTLTTMKNQIIIIANEKFEIYNVTENMKHCCKLGKEGQRLSPANKNNLMNFTDAQFEKFQKLGVIKTF